MSAVSYTNGNGYIDTHVEGVDSNHSGQFDTFVVQQDTNGDGNIDIVDLLKVQKDILGVNKLADAYREASDVNKDGVVDRNEFKSAISKEQDPLIKMQDIIKQKCFDIEDLAYRLEVTQDKEEFLSFYEFKNKMKRLDYSYTNEFIEGLFIDLCGDLNSKLSSKRMLDNFNVYKKEHFRNTNNVTFKNNFIRNIQQQVDFHTIKAAFEKEDLKFSGKVTKEVFCKIINTFKILKHAIIKSKILKNLKMKIS